ncbi:MAG: hypothetical protein IJX97_01105, partial [Clostridia bacterium]|nr:hypothetical protein [Clostridia bacterium]
GEWITDTNATCTVDGSKHQVCSVCNASIKTEAIAATGHTDGEWITDTNATCTVDGSKHQVCSVCNASIKTEAIAATGHTDGEWITDTNATCTVDGSKHQVCSVCQVTIVTESIAMLQHSHNFITVDPKTNTHYFSCFECDDIVTKKGVPLVATINSKSMGANGITWTVNASGGFGTYKYKFGVYDSSLSTCYYNSSIQSSNILTWPISNYSTSDFYNNNRIVRVTIYDNIGEITYSFKVDGSFVWKIDTVVVSPYTITYSTNQLTGSFYSTGLSSGTNGFNLLLQASSTGGYGNHKYQLIVYNYDLSLLYKSDIQSSPSLVWKTDFKSAYDFDNQILVVRIYDDLGYVEYAATILDYDIVHLSPYLFSSYKFTSSSQLQLITANIDYCYWSYVDSTCYVQDVISINGIQGGHGKYIITITYTDPSRVSHVYTYSDVDDLNITKYLGDASWAAHFRQSFPPFVTIEIEDELGFKTTYTAYFPTLNPDNYLGGYNLYSQKVSVDVSTEIPRNYSV